MSVFNSKGGECFAPHLILRLKDECSKFNDAAMTSALLSELQFVDASSTRPSSSSLSNFCFIGICGKCLDHARGAAKQFQGRGESSLQHVIWPEPRITPDGRRMVLHGSPASAQNPEISAACLLAFPSLPTSDAIHSLLPSTELQLFLLTYPTARPCPTRSEWCEALSYEARNRRALGRNRPF